MKYEIIHNKIMKIMELTLKITSKTKHDVFFDYIGHVNSLYVYVHLGGWGENKAPDFKKSVRINSCPSPEEDLNSIIENLNIVLDMSNEEDDYERTAG